MADKTVANAVSAFGASVKPKLASAAIAGAPEDQLRGPLEALIRGLAELGGLPTGAVNLVGETTLLDIKTRPDFAVTVSNALVGFIVAKVPGKRSRRFQPRHLGVELESQLPGFLIGQPAGHVRKDGPVKQDLVRIPRKLFRRAGFGQNLMQTCTNLVRIWPIGRSGRFGFEQFGLRVGSEQILLGWTCHA